MFVPARYFATEHDFVCQVVAEDANGNRRAIALDVSPAEADYLAAVYSALLAFGRLPVDFEQWHPIEAEKVVDVRTALRYSFIHRSRY